MACESTLGWALSGSIYKQSSDEMNCLEVLNMRCSVEEPVENIDILRQDLDKFWNIEDIGSSQCVVSKFQNEIYYDGNRYVTKLPFKVDHDFLRFLWLDSTAGYDFIVVFRFLRAVFGVTSSPFLLNATIRHHLSKYLVTLLKELIEKMLDDLYVDDLVSGCDSSDQGKTYYKNVKSVMSGAGFVLRKWVTNDSELSSYFASHENINGQGVKSNEDDASYCDTILPHADKNATVLGLRWDSNTDEFVFDFNNLLQKCLEMKKTKRGLLSTAASVFDPLGIVAPVTARIKTIFQFLCSDKLSWDDNIPQNILTIWEKFVEELKALNESEFQDSFLLAVIVI